MTPVFSTSARVVAPASISIIILKQPCPLCKIVGWTLVRCTDTSHDHCQPFESSITTRLPGCGRRYETTGTADTTGIQRAMRGLLRVLRPQHNEVSNMSQNAPVHSNSFPSGRPVVFRNATVLTIDPALGTIERGDVLVVDNRIAEVGRQINAPDSAVEIDASGGILMPGMVDTHRHMWQTALRGFGADWTLTNYFQFYYLNWGKIFRPEDIYAGNLLSAIEAVDAGVTTTVDWSHGLQTVDYADAAVDALEAVPGRFVLAYGNIQRAPAEWTAVPEFRDFVGRRITGDDMLGFQIAFDVTGDPTFPERPAFEVARDLGVAVTTHAGVWGATGTRASD